MDRILVIVAMEAEAAPLVAALDALEVAATDPLPMRVYEAAMEGLAVRIVVNGVDPRFGADAIGTVPAALTTHAAIEAWRPDLVVTAGTAGAWRRQRSRVGDVFVAWDRFVFHDHRIDLPVFAGLANADLAAADLRHVAGPLGFKLGVVTTGDSLDESEADRARILSSGAAVKDMEGAAVAWVADLHGVPVSALKTVTDLVDDPTPTAAQFTENLTMATKSLELAVVGMLRALARDATGGPDGAALTGP